MKKLFITLAASLTILVATATACAWWQADARINVRRRIVEAAVYNGLPGPIYCQGYVFGRTYQGQVLNVRMAGFVPPGRYAYVYVYTNEMNPFIAGWANIQCR